MVSIGEISENRDKLRDMSDFLEVLLILHETALFGWKINSVSHHLPQADIEEIIAKYKTLKPQLATKYADLL